MMIPCFVIIVNGPDFEARATSKTQTKGSALAASQQIWLAQPELRVPEGTCQV